MPPDSDNAGQQDHISNSAALTVTTSSDAVTVHAIFEPPHNFVEMHHYGNPDGLHYCPTGFAMCTGIHDGKQTDCTEVREFPGNCRLWAAAPTDDFDITVEEFEEARATGIPVRIVTSRREYLIRRRLNRWLRVRGQR